MKITSSGERTNRKMQSELYLFNNDDNVDNEQKHNYPVEAFAWRGRGESGIALPKVVQAVALLVACHYIGPIIIMIILRVHLENEHLMPYVPNERLQDIDRMLQIFGYTDLGIVFLLTLFYYIGAQQKKLKGFRKNDR